MASGDGWGSDKAPWLLQDAVPWHARHQWVPAHPGGTALAVLARAVLAPVCQSLLQPAWTAVCALPQGVGWHRVITRSSWVLPAPWAAFCRVCSAPGRPGPGIRGDGEVCLRERCPGSVGWSQRGSGSWRRVTVLLGPWYLCHPPSQCSRVLAVLVSGELLLHCWLSPR